jgi:sporulation protein YlmC with PRC-barrel domain
MDDLGDPVSHLALEEGVPVYDRDGERVGVVDRVVMDDLTGIFEGLIVHTRPVVPGRHLFASHEQVRELRGRGVRLAVGREDLYEIDEHAGRRRGGDDAPESAVEAALRKAWDWISGVR